MGRIRTLVLHVGMRHAGTDLLAQSLARLRPQLHRRGVALLTNDKLDDLPHADGWKRHKDSSPELAPLFAGDLRVAAGAELDAAARSGPTPRTLLVTSEQLTGGRRLGRGDRKSFRPYAEPAITQVIDALDPNRVHLVLYTRRQDRLMETCYVSDVQRGRNHSFAEQFPYRYQPILSYVTLADRLLSVPLVKSIRVRPYETIGAGLVPFVDTFLGAVELTGKLDLSALAEDPPQCAVYSRNALRLALSMNPYLDDDRERALVRTFLLEQFPTPPYAEARFISKRSRARIIDAYRADNEVLFATHMPDLPHDSYGSIEATRRLEEIEVSSRTHSQPRARRVARSIARRVRHLRRHRTGGS